MTKPATKKPPLRQTEVYQPGGYQSFSQLSYGLLLFVHNGKYASADYLELLDGRSLFGSVLLKSLLLFGNGRGFAFARFLQFQTSSKPQGDPVMAREFPPGRFPNRFVMCLYT